MKKAMIFGISALILLIGGIVFFCIYNYDKINFGEELLMYSDVTAEEYPVYVTYNGEKTEMTGYDKVQIYRAVLRGQSTRKRLMFSRNVESEGIMIHFGEEYLVTVYTYSAEEDIAYMEYENLASGKKKYYTVEKMKMIENIEEILNK